MENKVILITGASHGMGRALAVAFAEQGAALILLDNDLKNLNLLYNQLVAEYQANCAIQGIDLARASPDDYQVIIDKIRQRFGSLAGLIHCAGIFGELSPVEHLTYQAWYETLQVNLHSPFLLTQACLPLLKKSSQAQIIFTLDQQVNPGKAYWSALTASKAGLNGLMQCLADELAVNTAIQVHAVSLPPYQSHFRTQAYPGENQQTLPLPDEFICHYLRFFTTEKII